MNAPAPHIILATGGTGGHIFPALAVAQSLLESGAQLRIFTDARFAGYKPPEMEEMLAALPVHVVASGRSGGGIATRLKNMFGVLRGVLQARRLLKQHRPDVMVGFGGYPSLPSVLAAASLRVPIILHEQNAYLGRSNRLLLRVATLLATSHTSTHGIPKAQQHKLQHVGNPVRQAVRFAAETPYAPRTADTPLHVLVIGGSQGAKIFGELLPDALARLSEAERALLRMVQQTRPGTEAAVQARYKALGIEAECAAFFPDIAMRMAAAHMVVSRAGASSVAECCVAGRPALYIPLPSAMDNHQWFNAEAPANAGAAWRMTQSDATPERLAALIARAIAQPDELTQMAARANSLASPDAASALASRIIALCEQHSHD